MSKWGKPVIEPALRAVRINALSKKIWQEMVEREVSAWKANPNYIPVMPIPLERLGMGNNPFATKADLSDAPMHVLTPDQVRIKKRGSICHFDLTVPMEMWPLNSRETSVHIYYEMWRTAMRQATKFENGGYSCGAGGAPHQFAIGFRRIEIDEGALHERIQHFVGMVGINTIAGGVVKTLVWEPHPEVLPQMADWHPIGDGLDPRGAELTLRFPYIRLAEGPEVLVRIRCPR